MRPLPTEGRIARRLRVSYSRALTAARWIQAQCLQRVSVPARPHHHVLTSAHSTGTLLAPRGSCWPVEVSGGRHNGDANGDAASRRPRRAPAASAMPAYDARAYYKCKV